MTLVISIHVSEGLCEEGQVGQFVYVCVCQLNQPASVSLWLLFHNHMADDESWWIT